MRIATATLSKGLLLFRRPLCEKIGPVAPKRMSPRSSSSLPDRRCRDVAARYASTMRHARTCPPSRVRIDPFFPVSSRAPTPSDRRKFHDVVDERAAGRDARTISRSPTSLEAHARLSRTIDGEETRSRRTPRLRSEYLQSTAKTVPPYLTDEQEENVAGRIGEEASWKCAIARRRGSLQTGRRGQRRCRYVEKKRRC